MSTNMPQIIAKNFERADGVVKKLAEIHRFAQEKRNVGRPLTFRQAIAAYSIENGILTGRAIDEGPELIYEQLGINPMITTMRDLLTTPDVRPWTFIIAEVILDAIQLGFAEDDWTPEFISTSKDAIDGVATVPRFPRNINEIGRESSEGADPLRTTVAFGEKVVTSRKFAHAFDVERDVIMRSSIDMVSHYLKLATLNHRWKKKRFLIEVLINGDGAKDKQDVPIDESIGDIGIENTGTGLTYDDDLLEVWTMMGECEVLPNNIICSRKNAKKLLKMDEFKEPKTGMPVKTLKLRQPLPSEQNIFSHVINENHFIFVNSGAVLGQLNTKALTIETDNIIRHDKFDIVGREEYGLFCIMPTARILVDVSTTLAENPWPEYFAPHEFKTKKKA